MMKRPSLGKLKLVFLAFLAACRETPTQSEMLVFAAASTADALTEIGRDFQVERGVFVRFSFGASRDLARQIRATAPADLFVSADAETIEGLVEASLVRPEDRRILMSNHLVVIVPQGAAPTLHGPGDLRNAPHIALGDPALVPAGTYAKKWLETEGVWEDVKDRVVPALDVRAALAAVEAGHAEVGIVYLTDAKRSRRVQIAFEVPADRAPTISYVGARLARSTVASSKPFLDFLTGGAARATFARHGFVPR